MIFIFTVVKWIEYKSLELKPFFLSKVTWIVWMIPSQLFSFVCELVSLTTGCQINFSALIKSKRYIPSIPKGLKSERIISSKAFVGHKQKFPPSLPCANPKERWWYWYFIKTDNTNSHWLWVCAVKTVFIQRGPRQKQTALVGHKSRDGAFLFNRVIQATEVTFEEVLKQSGNLRFSYNMEYLL